MALLGPGCTCLSSSRQPDPTRILPKSCRIRSMLKRMPRSLLVTALHKCKPFVFAAPAFPPQPRCNPEGPARNFDRVSLLVLRDADHFALSHACIHVRVRCQDRTVPAFCESATLDSPVSGAHDLELPDKSRTGAGASARTLLNGTRRRSSEVDSAQRMDLALEAGGERGNSRIVLIHAKRATERGAHTAPRSNVGTARRPLMP